MPSKPAAQGSQSQTTQSTSKIELPAWLESAAQQVVGQANAYGQVPGGGGAQPIPQYQVAPITQPGQTDIAALQSNVGSTNPAFATAQGGAQSVMGYQPQQVTPGFLSGTNLSPYLNPYTQDVIDKTMPLLEQQRQAANNQTADLASKTGAFGGSRQGVAEGVNNAQSGLYAGQLGAQLNQANFSQAQQAALADLNRSLTAQQSNQAAGLTGAGLNLSAAGQLGNLTAQGQQSNLQGLSAALGGQTQLQQQQQAQSDAPYQDAVRRLQLQLSAVGGVPYGQTQTSTQTGLGPGPTSNPWLTGLGALGTATSIAGNAYQAFSDRTAKTDIKKIGTDKETDLPLYAYRYKGDPKTYPKVVGIMAQDVAKKYPGQVSEVAGKLVVNADFGPMRRSFLG